MMEDNTKTTKSKTTEEEIDRLNEATAEKVMGWKVIKKGKTSACWHIEIADNHSVPFRTWNPACFIGDAKTVIDKLIEFTPTPDEIRELRGNEDTWFFSIEAPAPDDSPQQWYAGYKNEDNNWIMNAMPNTRRCTTLELAVCYAAINIVDMLKKEYNG